jgi:hypothetical protein
LGYTHDLNLFDDNFDGFRGDLEFRRVLDMLLDCAQLGRADEEDKYFFREGWNLDLDVDLAYHARIGVIVDALDDAHAFGRQAAAGRSPGRKSCAGAKGRKEQSEWSRRRTLSPPVGGWSVMTVNWPEMRPPRLPGKSMIISI